MLAKLHGTVFPDGPWDEAFWRGAIASSHDLILVLEDRAFIALRLIGPEAEILTVGTTLPGKGDGMALVEEAKLRALAAGAQRLFLEVSIANKAALGLYGKAGFARVGNRPNYYSDGSDAAIMRFDLAQGDE
nr:GNAT family N-acetyltransferase [Parvularcula mediterranea]